MCEEWHAGNSFYPQETFWFLLQTRSDQVQFNPFTAPAGKVSGLKDAQICLQTVDFLVLLHVCFQCCAF